jgi:hypothetical protein
LSGRLCDATAAGFALWTLCCHAVVVAGGSLDHLIAAFAVVGAGIGFLWLRGRGNARAEEASPVPGDERTGPRRTALRWATLALGCVTALTLSPEQHPVALWWIVVASLGVAAATQVVLVPPQRIAASRSRGLELTLWGIAGACAWVALGVHRPDLDDSFYINVAVAAADDPGRALFSGDTLLGVAGLPLHMPAHRLHSYELWNGAVSRLTRIPALYVFHWLAAAFVALLIPLSHARLFRELTPKHWIWSVAACVVVLLAAGETHRSYGNFAFVRSWQGKAIFLFVFMPLVYSYAIRFALRPTLNAWLLLAAAQIGALGCSSTAVWAAPAGALTALCCGIRPTRRGVTTFALGALASGYVLLAGSLLRGELQPMLAPEIREFAAGAQFDSALTHVFGTSALLQFGVATLIVAWACCARDLGRRFATLLPLAMFVVLLNPYWDRFVSANVTGPSFWRAMWALPVPALMALVLTAPLQFDFNRSARTASRVACVALLALFALGVPRYATFSADNGGAGGLGIWTGMPAPKIPPALLTWSRMLHEAVPSGAIVVAPANVSVWNPLFHARTHPLQARRLYLQRHAAVLGADDANERMLMTRFVGGENGWTDARTGFRDGLDRFSVAGVCLRDSEFAQTARDVMQEAGFIRSVEGPRYEIWVRKGVVGRS